jgi:hypothetical protein
MTQQLIVGLIVLVAALSATWRWMPVGWRRAAARQLAAGSQRVGLVDKERADRLAASLAKSSGCGACDSCGACGKTDTKKTSNPLSAGTSPPATPNTSGR